MRALANNKSMQAVSPKKSVDKSMLWEIAQIKHDVQKRRAERRAKR